jgi:D-xylose transport system permease protein
MPDHVAEENLQAVPPADHVRTDTAAAASLATARRGAHIRELSMLATLAIIWIFFAVREPLFLSSRNLSLLMIELSVTAILALGMLLVILPGHIDLSAGSGVGLFGGLAAVLVTRPDMWLPGLLGNPWPAPIALALVMVLGVAIWAGMGTLIIRQRIPAFIITLGGLLVFKGLHWLVIQNQTIPVGQDNFYAALTTFYLKPIWGLVLAAMIVAGLVWARLSARARRARYGFAIDDAEITFLKLFIAAQVIFLLVLITNQYRGMPLPAMILAAVALFVYVLTQHTPFGRYLYAIGGNEEAAVISGVPVERIVIGAFALMGLIVAITGFMQTAYAGSSTSTVGELMELDAIAACGTSLRGGRGSVLGVLFGALIMASLLNGMTLMAVSPEIKLIARGLVLALAVWMDVRLTRRG